MKKFILFISFICVTITSTAQIHEIGLIGGGVNYIGDIGPEYYINPNNIMGGIIYKWNINPRIALRGTLNFAELSASDSDASNEGRKERGLSFTNSIQELAVGIEYSFFKYDINSARHRQTPYLLVGLGAIHFKGATDQVNPSTYLYGSKFSAAIPFGFGYKFAIGRRFAMALELRTAYTFTDQIDYNNPDIPSLNFGNPNSNDWYTFVGVSFVYAFGRPPCYETPY